MKIMEFKGTKGEWRIGNHFSHIVTDTKTERPTYSEEDYRSEREYYGGYIICESVSKKADAKLIAAAPELLKALINLLPAKQAIEDYGMEREIEFAEQAIKEALAQ